ncbi:hypothetical protein [Holospora undulata]|uniref:Lipoprotein n=1 Tax=Holospora undulata HU1 TaxID=1321371 RepID=A0A061JIL9_9PROT|nr:hypothetical protein [Holospora undulata]ETZ05532.1 hypothetical protein K737_300026 [Holospora undulata HU1]
MKNLKKLYVLIFLSGSCIYAGGNQDYSVPTEKETRRRKEMETAEAFEKEMKKNFDDVENMIISGINNTSLVQPVVSMSFLSFNGDMLKKFEDDNLPYLVGRLYRMKDALQKIKNGAKKLTDEEIISITKQDQDTLREALIEDVKQIMKRERIFKGKGSTGWTSPFTFDQTSLGQMCMKALNRKAFGKSNQSSSYTEGLFKKISEMHEKAEALHTMVGVALFVFQQSELFYENPQRDGASKVPPLDEGYNVSSRVKEQVTFLDEELNKLKVQISSINNVKNRENSKNFDEMKENFSKVLELIYKDSISVEKKGLDFYMQTSDFDLKSCGEKEKEYFSKFIDYVQKELVDPLKDNIKKAKHSNAPTFSPSSAKFNPLTFSPSSAKFNAPTFSPSSASLKENVEKDSSSALNKKQRKDYIQFMNS